MALNRARKISYPQLPQAPDDYPVFPDVSTWPVVFPELPANSNGRFARPPQHPSKAVAPQIPADQVPNHVAVVMEGLDEVVASAADIAEVHVEDLLARPEIADHVDDFLAGIGQHFRYRPLAEIQPVPRALMHLNEPTFPKWPAA